IQSNFERQVAFIKIDEELQKEFPDLWVTKVQYSESNGDSHVNYEITDFYEDAIPYSIFDKLHNIPITQDETLFGMR
ncbi:MAG: hypothetical protein AAF960_05610, partial [Bacteroidota bacterium]